MSDEDLSDDLQQIMDDLDDDLFGKKKTPKAESVRRSPVISVIYDPPPPYSSLPEYPPPPSYHEAMQEVVIKK